MTWFEVYRHVPAPNLSGSSILIDRTSIRGGGRLDIHLGSGGSEEWETVCDARENRRSMPHSRETAAANATAAAMSARCLTVMSSYNNSGQLPQGGTLVLINGTPAALWIVLMVDPLLWTKSADGLWTRMNVLARSSARVSLAREDSSSPSYRDADDNNSRRE